MDKFTSSDDKGDIFAILGKNSSKPSPQPSYEKQAEEKHAQKIKDQEQKREQRFRFETRIFRLLYAQVIFLMAIVTLQGFGWFNFSLNQWVFGFFINGSLIQTYLLAKHIAADLFNNSKKNKKTRVQPT